MNDELSDQIERCLKILEENIDILTNIEQTLEDQQEDEMVTDLELHHLYDMADEVAETAKLKRAESNLMRRKIG